MGKIKQEKDKYSFFTNNINVLSFILFWGGLVINIHFFFILDNFDSGGIMSSNPSYSWEANSSLAIVSLFIFLMAGVILSDITNKYSKFITSLCLFIFVLLLKPFMFFMDAELRFTYTPIEKQYVDKNTGQINNVEKYTSLLLKYCLKWKNRTCNGKYADDFQTIDDYIYVLNFANKNNYRDLYKFTIEVAERKGKLETLIKVYNDKNFYVSIIKNSSKFSTINLIKNQKIDAETSSFININITHIQNWEQHIDGFSVDKANKYSNNFTKKTNHIIQNMKNINTSLFTFY